MRRYKVLLMVLAIIIGVSFPVYANSVPSEWAIPYVKLLNENERYNESVLFGEYQEDLTREDAAYMAVILYEELTNTSCSVGEAYFDDSSDVYVLKAKNHNLVNGKSEYIFSPMEPITREEIAVVLYNVIHVADMAYQENSLEFFLDDESISTWANKAVYVARSNGYLGGVGNNLFDPSAFITREQTVAAIIKTLAVFQGQIPEENVYQLLDSKLNNVVFDSDIGQVVLSLSNTSMITNSVDGEIDIYFIPMDDFDIRISKYDDERHLLIPLTFEAYDSETDNDFDLNDFSLSGQGSQFSILLEYEEDESLVLNFDRYSGYTKYETFDYINVDPIKLLNSRIITKSIDGSGVEVHKNYGQYVVERNANAIVYQIDGSLKAQYVTDQIVDERADDYYIIEVDDSFLFLEVKFSSVLETLDDFTLLFKNNEISIDTNMIQIPKIEHLGYENATITIHSFEGESVHTY